MQGNCAHQYWYFGMGSVNGWNNGPFGVGLPVSFDDSGTADASTADVELWVLGRAQCDPAALPLSRMKYLPGPDQVIISQSQCDDPTALAPPAACSGAVAYHMDGEDWYVVPGGLAGASAGECAPAAAL